MCTCVYICVCAYINIFLGLPRKPKNMTPNNNEYKDHGLQITFSTKMRQSAVKNWLIARLGQGCTGDPMASSCIRKLTPQRMMGKY